MQGSPGSEVHGLQEGPPSAPVGATSKSGLWHLRGVPLLEALRSVGVLGADVPTYLDRAVSIPPATLPEGRKSIGHPAEMDLIFFLGFISWPSSFGKKSIGKPGP